VSLKNFALLLMVDIMYVLFSPSMISLHNSLAGSGPSYWFTGVAFWALLLTLGYYTVLSFQRTFLSQQQSQRRRRRR